MAAAIGAGLPVSEPTGSLIVDIGGGTTEVAVISLGGIVVSRSMRIGGDEMDQDIVAFARREYNLLMGERTAEDIKIAVGSAYPGRQRRATVTLPRPRPADRAAAQRRGQRRPDPRGARAVVAQIVDAIKDTIEETPPELVADIMDQGIVLAGGGALLAGPRPARRGGDPDAGPRCRRPADLRRARHAAGCSRSSTRSSASSSATSSPAPRASPHADVQPAPAQPRRPLVRRLHDRQPADAARQLDRAGADPPARHHARARSGAQRDRPASARGWRGCSARSARSIGCEARTPTARELAGARAAHCRARGGGARERRAAAAARHHRGTRHGAPARSAITSRDPSNFTWEVGRRRRDR